MAELVEGARLEIVFRGNSDKGSNPFLSAKKTPKLWGFLLFLIKKVAAKVGFLLINF